MTKKKPAPAPKSNLGVAASKVSSNVLKMQFMRKTLLRIDQEERTRKKDAPAKEEEAAEVEMREAAPKASRIYTSVQTIHDEPTCSLGGVLTEERFTVLESLRFGRFSYKGQNPEVEKLMVYHECIRLGLEPPDDKQQIPTEAPPAEDGELLDEDDYEYEVCGPRLR